MKKKQFLRDHLENKKIGILGMGISNIALAHYLDSHDIVYDVFDRNPNLNISVKGSKFLGENYMDHLHGYDVIIRSPGIKCRSDGIVRETERGAWLTSETELFMKMCPAKIIGVTGSDGKTTTTTLIYEILKASGIRTRIGGNIGLPLISVLDDIEEDEIIVMELSSFQLQTFDISPEISVITNISPNHLDYHEDMEEYVMAKKNIIRFQDTRSVAVLNYDNIYTRDFEVETFGKTILFSGKQILKEGIYLNRANIVVNLNGRNINYLDTKMIRLKGFHNVENFMAAIGAVYGIAKKEAIEKVALNFRGVEHRNEFVRMINGIEFYNDSIASTPTRTTATLSCFNEKVILIAGGYDKKISYIDFGKVLVEKVKIIVLTGPTSEKILEGIKEHDKNSSINVITAIDLEEAVNISYSLAEKGDCILLSPASASFDSFKNFEQRGNMYKEYVNKLVLPAEYEVI